ncbi:MAG: hypothetical protein CSA42_00515 [Gammaproteobacteria bacterium]|nr:MAG: hypothetical protein CSA42_00515 [Gammaproteobacteria bacterium]
MKKTINKLIITAALVSPLTACVNTMTTNINQNATTYPVAAVLKQARLNGVNKTLITDLNEVMGDQDITITMNYKRDPIDMNNPQLTTFNKQQVIKTNSVSEIKINEQTLYTLNAEEYIMADSLMYAGTNTANFDIDIVTQNFTPPATAQIGAHGKLYEGISSALEDKAETIPMLGTWELNAANNHTAELCTIEKHDNQGESTICYTINQQGDILDTQVSGSFIITPGEPPVNFVSE